MSSASSEQLCVRKEAGYDEVFPLSQDDLSTLSDERNPSATLPSSRDEDLDTDGLASDSNDGHVGAKPPRQSVIVLDGLREFIMLPLWMVNDFISSIKQTHFDTLREKYQIPIHIPIRLPYKSIKCYYRGVDDVEMYKQMLKARLKFPLSALHRRLLQYLGLAVTQISPNAWKVFLDVEVLYGVMYDGARRLIMEDFFHCYRPSKITQSRGMYIFLLRSLLLRLVCETLDSNRNWKSRYFFIQGDD